MTCSRQESSETAPIVLLEHYSIIYKVIEAVTNLLGLVIFPRQAKIPGDTDVSSHEVCRLFLEVCKIKKGQKISAFLTSS